MSIFSIPCAGISPTQPNHGRERVIFVMYIVCGQSPMQSNHAQSTASGFAASNNRCSDFVLSTSPVVVRGSLSSSTVPACPLNQPLKHRRRCMVRWFQKHELIGMQSGVNLSTGMNQEF